MPCKEIRKNVLTQYVNGVGSYVTWIEENFSGSYYISLLLSGSYNILIKTKQKTKKKKKSSFIIPSFYRVLLLGE